MHPLIVQNHGESCRSRGDRKRQGRSQVADQRQTQKVPHHNVRRRKPKLGVPWIEMVRPVCSRNDEFDGAAKECEGLEVFKLRVNEPLLQRPGNEDAGNYGEVINGPLADIDPKGQR